MKASILGMEILADFDTRKGLPCEMSSAARFRDDLFFAEPLAGSSGFVIARKGKRVFRLLSDDIALLIKVESSVRNIMRL
ncbi:MAG TPA: hypothetical protein PKA82_14890 [Pyrinomonadaceae bacterium]|nr:hypothetical protein [Pyrinomonadaceae bacterium]